MAKGGPGVYYQYEDDLGECEIFLTQEKDNEIKEEYEQGLGKKRNEWIDTEFEEFLKYLCTDDRFAGMRKRK